MGVPGSADLMVLATAAQAGGTAYQIEQSLRFKKASSTQLTRTFGTCTASGGPWTTSMWVKLGFESESDIYALWGADTGTSTSGDNYGTLNSGRKWSDYVERNNGTWGMGATVQGVARDLSAWYHYLLSYNQPNGATLWINGVQQTYTYSNGGSSSGGNFGSEASQWNRNGVTGSIGAAYTTNGYSNFHWSGAIAEVHHLDGTAVSDPYDFGEFDDNGVWRPIEVSGVSYGNQGFYLKFDPTATNGIGHDHSGNGNNWTPSNFTTSGASSDVINDTPTTNHATMLPTWPFGVSQAVARYYANANHQYHSGRNSPALSYPSILLPESGKYYVEFTCTAGGSGGAFYAGNLFVISNPKTGDSYGTSITSYEGGYGATTYNGSAGTSGSSWRSGPHNVAIAIDMDTGDVEYFLAGVSQSTGTISAANLALGPLCITMSGATGSSTTVTYDINFGTRDFVYTPPTGYTGLGTATMPEPAVKNPGDHFKTVLYTGNGQSSQAITGVGFQPDFVWIKNRGSGNNGLLQDVVRGANEALVSAYSVGETLNNGNGHVDSFDSDGFTVGWDGANNGGDTNASGNNYVAWCWKAGGSASSNTAGNITTSTISANPTAGFSIVSYTAENAVRTVGHGLGVKPALIIVKDRDASQNWAVYHGSLGATKGLYLDLNTKQETNSGYWNNTEPTSTVFTIGTNTRTGGSTNDYIAYCFAEVEGYSKIGTYTGNGSSSDSPFIYLGFRPAMILLKNYAGGSETSWILIDSVRDTYNVAHEAHRPNEPDADVTNSLPNVDFLSNGFKLRTSWADMNESGSLFAYFAIAEHPFGGEGVSPAPAR